MLLIARICPFFLKEMRPKWYSLEEIPFKEMWPDDVYWFPLMLKGKHFYGYFTFKGMNDIVDYKLREVENIHDVPIPQGPQDTTCRG